MEVMGVMANCMLSQSGEYCPTLTPKGSIPHPNAQRGGSAPTGCGGRRLILAPYISWHVQVRWAGDLDVYTYIYIYRSIYLKERKRERERGDIIHACVATCSANPLRQNQVQANYICFSNVPANGASHVTKTRPASLLKGLFKWQILPIMAPNRILLKLSGQWRQRTWENTEWDILMISMHLKSYRLTPRMWHVQLPNTPKSWQGYPCQNDIPLEMSWASLPSAQGRSWPGPRNGCGGEGLSRLQQVWVFWHVFYIVLKIVDLAWCL